MVALNIILLSNCKQTRIDHRGVSDSKALNAGFPFSRKMLERYYKYLVQKGFFAPRRAGYKDMHPYVPVQSHWSTRIKDAGIAIRHSRGYAFFHTAGSRNGSEWLDGKGPRPKLMKKESQIIKKGVRPKVQNPKLGLPITPRPF